MAGQFRTSADLVTEALANLGVLSAGQPTDPEDFNYVKEKLDSIIRKLAGLEIVYVADVENIPGAWFDDLADIVAGECTSKFGITGQDATDLIAKGLGVPPGTGAGAQSLKAQSRLKPTYEVLHSEYL